MKLINKEMELRNALSKEYVHAVWDILDTMNCPIADWFIDLITDQSHRRYNVIKPCDLVYGVYMPWLHSHGNKETVLNWDLEN